MTNIKISAKFYVDVHYNADPEGAMQKRPVFLFFPTEATVHRVGEYRRAILAKYKNALTAISFSEEDDEMADLAFHSGFFDIKVPFRRGDKLMRRAFSLLSQVIFEDDFDIVVFNTAMLRYDTRHFTQFVDKARTLPNNLILGTPKILHIDNKKSLEGFLTDNEEVRKALMVDIFISYAMSRCDQHIFGAFTNLNAGIFAVRPHFLGDPSGVLRSILAMKIYKDMDLLAPLMAWNIFRAETQASLGRRGLSIAQVELPVIKLSPMAKCLDERIHDLRFTIKLLEGRVGSLIDLVNDVFLNVPFLRSVFTDSLRPWFEVEVLGVKEYEQERQIPPESSLFKKKK